MVVSNTRRVLTTGSAISVDVDHFTSGWTDIQDFSKPGKWTIKTFNKISPLGLAKFPPSLFDISGEAKNASAILLRSHKLQESEVDITVRAIAR